MVRNRIDGGAQAGVYFPEDAYNAVKEARKLYPLPNVTRPGKMSDKPDETGAEYTPTQLYLWDSKKSLYELAEWVHEKYIENERELVEKRIELGKKTDKLAAERRRMLREAAGKNWGTESLWLVPEKIFSQRIAFECNNSNNSVVWVLFYFL